MYRFYTDLDRDREVRKDIDDHIAGGLGAEVGAEVGVEVVNGEEGECTMMMMMMTCP